MISSGTKRGLAAAAVSALALAGIPALATSASAAGTDFTLLGTGPVLSGGHLGGVVVIKYPTGSTVPTVGNLKVTNTALNNTSPDNATQDIGIVTRVQLVADGTAPDVANDGFSTAAVFVPVTTTTVGATANYAIFMDTDPANPLLPGDGLIQATEPRVQVSVKTSGKVAQIAITPASQVAAAGVASAPYTLAIKDSAGNPTQLDGASFAPAAGDQAIVLNGGGALINDITTTADDTLLAQQLVSGSATFTATGPVANGANVYTIMATTNANVTPTVSANATLDVVRPATLVPGNIDVVTAADSWNGFGNPVDLDGNPNATSVRVDQTSIRIDIQSNDVADRGATVVFSLNGTDLTPDDVADGNGITFGGKAAAQVTTVLNDQGVGSVTITPDAGTIQENDSFTLSGNNFNQTFKFQRATVAAIQPAAKTYVSAIDGSVTVVANVVDQFGLPAASGEVSAKRRAGGPNPGPNPDATVQRKAIANGQVSFTFTDVNAVPGQSDIVDFEYFTDQFDATGAFGASTIIKYTVDGQGADFTTRLDNITASGTGYNPATNTIVPLADTVFNDVVFPPAFPNEGMTLDVINAEPNAPITVSVDNGALILKPGQTLLSQGVASVTTAVTAGGTLAAGYHVIGTKSGLTTVTIVAANRTETAQFTVAAETNPATARNVTVSGPATGESGGLANFKAVVTDAFGNPIAGIPVSALNVQVSGPGELQDTGASTDATGTVALNVRLEDNAVGAVTITVTGTPAANNQFGAAADRLTAAATTDNGKGLTKSSNVATATLTASAPPAPAKSGIELKVTGKDKGKTDKVTAKANGKAKGLTAKLFKGNKKIASHKLNDKGDYTFSVKDKNGKDKTKYTVKVAESSKTKAANKSIKIK